LASEGFPVPDADIPIVPLVLGDERAAMALCQAAIEGGVFAQAIRPPTVPEGTSRLRLAAMASHTSADMAKAARVLAAAARKLSLEVAEIGAPPTRAPLEEPWVEEHDGEQGAALELEAHARSAPFDIENGSQPAPSAPFDRERDGEVARAA
jgi:hypothetical protein